MTGALNRDTFFQMLEAFASNGRGGSLLYIDADYFKRINDSFGHQTGDEALRGIARAIAAALDEDDIWGRIGGEEFAVCLATEDPEAALQIAEKIRYLVENITLFHKEKVVPISVSIGAVTFASGFHADRMASEADRRLYRAKRYGRNRVVANEKEISEAELSEVKAVTVKVEAA
jgi:diguanylate cyclase (GGDEF)-like protein